MITSFRYGTIIDISNNKMYLFTSIYSKIDIKATLKQDIQRNKYNKYCIPFNFFMAIKIEK